MSDINVEEIIDFLSGKAHCKYFRYGIDYDCDGGVRSDGTENPIYSPCADGWIKIILIQMLIWQMWWKHKN